MINLTEYLIQEMKAETYLNAAKKAKELGDPRAQKFMQAYRDAINKEIDKIEAEEAGTDEQKKLYKFYQEDRKIMRRLKSLGTKVKGEVQGNKSDGQFMYVLNEDYGAMVYIAGDENKQYFFREDLVKTNSKADFRKEYWTNGELDKLDPSERFTFIELLSDGFCDFFYAIDSDLFIPVLCTSYKSKRKMESGEDCYKLFTENDLKYINEICEALNPSHKYITSKK